jgi:ureidoglycolate hydrolase
LVERTYIAEQMSAEGFKEFGTVLDPTDDKVALRMDFVTHWHDLGRLDCLGEDPVIAFMRSLRREFVVDKMERHNNTAEIFFPVEGMALMPYAPSLSDGSPDIDNFQVFICKAGLPFISNRGVWHWVPYPIGESFSSYLLVENDLIENDLESYELGERLILKI